MRQPIKILSKDYKLVAFLAAFCFFLSAIEYMIPKPLPFMRLGLSNLPIVLALELLPGPKFFLLVLLKSLGMSFISGSLISYVFLFSLAGSFASGIVMFLLKKVFGERIGFVGASVMGASFSNLAQIGMARAIVFGRSAWLIAPPFLAAGTLTGLLLGLFCERFASVSAWYRAALLGREGGGNPEHEAGHSGDGVRLSAKDLITNKSALKGFAGFAADKLSPNALFLSGLAMGSSFLFAPSLPVRAAMFFAFFIFACAIGKRAKLLASLLVMGGIVLFNLFAPAGKVLAKLWNFRITETALLEGIEKAMTLQGLFFLSRATVRPDLRLAGAFGEAVSRAFFWFESIVARRPSFDAKDPFASIDTLMVSLYALEPESSAGKGRKAYPVLGYLLLSILPLISWAASLFA